MRFMYWVNSLSAGLRQGLFLGAWVVARFVQPLLPLYLAFAYFSWFNDVLFESPLRFNRYGRYGRYALSEAQRRHSNHFLILLGVAVAAGAALALAGAAGLSALSMVALGLLFPLVGTERLSHQPTQQARSRWAGWTLAACGGLSVTLELAGVGGGFDNLLFLAFLFGTLAYTWVFALR